MVLYCISFLVLKSVIFLIFGRLMQSLSARMMNFLVKWGFEFFLFYGKFVDVYYVVVLNVAAFHNYW